MTESDGIAFCVIVRDIEHSEEIIAVLMEAGASGVTIVHSHGLSQATFHTHSAELSIASVLSSLFTSEKHENRLLICLTKDEAQVKVFCERVAQASPNIDQRGSLIHFAIPINHLRGIVG